MMPMMETGAKRSAQARHLNHHALFYALEANKSTCCISISNERQKSRASIILFRGRILSCVHGRRGLPYHTYGADAFHSTLVDLGNPLTQVTAHALSEGLALAASSVFLGEKKEQKPRQELGNFVQSTQEHISKIKQPGCIVFKDVQMQTHCILYLCNGEIAGLYSFQVGWIEKKVEQYLSRFVAKEPHLLAQAFVLRVCSLESLYDLTIGLSGLPSSRADKLSWITSPVSQDSLAPMETHMLAEPALKDTFRLNHMPRPRHRRDLCQGISFPNSATRHGRFVNSGRRANLV